jgi:hypothetical protein
MSVAGGIIFQVDQATSADQKFLWQFRKCGEDPSLDSGVGLRSIHRSVGRT